MILEAQLSWHGDGSLGSGAEYKAEKVRLKYHTYTANAP